MLTIKLSPSFYKANGTIISTRFIIEDGINWRICRLVKISDNSIIGSMYLFVDTFVTNPHVEIELLRNYTTEDNENKINNIGRFLINEAFLYSIEKNCCGRLCVKTKTRNHNYYKNIGFEATYFFDQDNIIMYLSYNTIIKWLNKISLKSRL